MRILIHDFGGYSFPVQLSRALADRGHNVHYLCFQPVCAGRGRLEERSGDPASLDLDQVALQSSYDKGNLIRRYWQERTYGKALADRVHAIQPDIVLSANTPLVAQDRLLRATRSAGADFIYWLQDLRGVAARKILSNRIPLAGSIVGAMWERWERLLLRRSDEVVVITEDFVPLLEQWGVSDDSVRFVPNWTPLEDVPTRPRDNRWARERDLEDKLCLLYSGTMGWKHDPDLVVELARAFDDCEDVRVVVVAQGTGADYLREEKEERDLGNLLLYDLQPYDRLPSVLATADVLFGMLEPYASVCSVPSKVLTYLCAGRPLLLNVPEANMAAQMVREADAGVTTAPGDREAFVEGAKKLLSDESLRKRLGRHGRQYAEKRFDIEGITDTFESILRT